MTQIYTVLKNLDEPPQHYSASHPSRLAATDATGAGTKRDNHNTIFVALYGQVGACYPYQ